MEGLTAILFSICILAVLLLIGKVMRVKIRLFQRIFLPSSIIGGFIGLAVGPFGFDLIPEFILGTWGEIPGVLINIVFATLFLGVAIPGIKKVWSMGGSQLCFGAVIGTGQYFVALLVTALVLTPFFGVNHEFGTILEIGFSGGHGTAAGMTSVFEAVGFPEGTALAYMSATVGIIVAVVGGIIFINIAIRKDQCVNFDKNESIPEYKKKGLIKEQADRYSNSEATVASESIEPLAFHFSVVAVAVLIGWGLLHFVRKAHPQLEGFPLFPLAMIGGMIIQIISKPLKLTTYYDKNTFDRILGISLDFLVVAAISTLRLDLFLENVWPFLILMAVGIAWIMFCLVFLAPKMFPNNWFERGITEYGMQTGVTAIGLLLLRLVDPHYKTDTAQSFGFKQIIYEPFLGGGFITATIPFIVFSKGIWWSIIVAGSLAVFFFLLSWLNGWVNFRRRAWRN
jgi:ESS family glutamate:Na+ symporter